MSDVYRTMNDHIRKEFPHMPKEDYALPPYLQIMYLCAKIADLQEQIRLIPPKNWDNI